MRTRERAFWLLPQHLPVSFVQLNCHFAFGDERGKKTKDQDASLLCTVIHFKIVTVTYSVFPSGREAACMLGTLEQSHLQPSRLSHLIFLSLLFPWILCVAKNGFVLDSGEPLRTKPTTNPLTHCPQMLPNNSRTQPCPSSRTVFDRVR